MLSFTVAVELTVVTARSDVFCPAATVYLKISVRAGASGVGRGAAVVESECWRAAVLTVTSRSSLGQRDGLPALRSPTCR